MWKIQHSQRSKKEKQMKVCSAAALLHCHSASFVCRELKCGFFISSFTVERGNHCAILFYINVIFGQVLWTLAKKDGDLFEIGTLYRYITLAKALVNHRSSLHSWERHRPTQLSAEAHWGSERGCRLIEDQNLWNRRQGGAQPPSAGPGSWLLAGSSSPLGPARRCASQDQNQAVSLPWPLRSDFAQISGCFSLLPPPLPVELGRA